MVRGERATGACACVCKCVHAEVGGTNAVFDNPVISEP